MEDAPLHVCECLYDPRWKFGMLPDGNMVMRLVEQTKAYPNGMDFIICKETAAVLLTFLKANFEELPQNATAAVQRPAMN
jgi:hypothetical protein